MHLPWASQSASVSVSPRSHPLLATSTPSVAYAAAQSFSTATPDTVLLPTGRLSVELWPAARARCRAALSDEAARGLPFPVVSGSWDLTLDRNSSPPKDYFPRQAYTYSAHRAAYLALLSTHSLARTESSLFQRSASFLS